MGTPGPPKEQTQLPNAYVHAYARNAPTVPCKCVFVYVIYTILTDRTGGLQHGQMEPPGRRGLRLTAEGFTFGRKSPGLEAETEVGGGLAALDREVELSPKAGGDVGKPIKIGFGGLEQARDSACLIGVHSGQFGRNRELRPAGVRGHHRGGKGCNIHASVPDVLADDTTTWVALMPHRHVAHPHMAHRHVPHRHVPHRHDGRSGVNFRCPDRVPPQRVGTGFSPR
jgi:hypothetical protein